MKFAVRLSLIIFLMGIAVLLISIFSVYTMAYESLVEDRLGYRKMLVKEVALSIENHLKGKVSIVKTLSVAPVFKDFLNKSNNYYGEMSVAEREKKIEENNATWKNTLDVDNVFVKEYTDNVAAEYLKTQQDLFKDEYGEIFLTDKYGALVASTAKLTTFAHGHKYWWNGAYNEGNGAVFFDDRGYDDSVDGYVLGLVVPVYEKNEIVGILKANINIMGGISSVILNSQTPETEKIQLIRSDGLIIFEENTLPLTSQVSSEILNHIALQKNDAFVFESHQNKWVIGYAPIALTWGKEGFVFGGSAESIDHENGNTGQSWGVLDKLSFQLIDEELEQLLFNILTIGLILTVGLALTAYLSGKAAAKPIRKLAVKLDELSAGDFNSKVTVRRRDEIGLLADSFNKMVENLRNSTTSIKKLNAEIERRKATERELKEARETAENSNLAKSEFLDNMSHELRTPLNGILGFSQLLETTELNDRQQDFVATIVQCGKTLLDIISDILDLSKIEAGKLEISPQKTKLITILKQSADIVRYKALEKGIALVENISGQLPKMVEVDDIRLKQILLNLLSNAVKFTDEGSVSLTVNSRKLDQASKRMLLHFSVKDTGIGIKKENLSKIFDKFHQENLSTTKQYGGTGLGLAISNQLLEKMGSQLKVSSQKGVGSEFSFELDLPFYDAKEIEKDNDADKRLSKESQKAIRETTKILIVEDNKINRDLLKHILSSFFNNLLVVEARDGREAYQKFKEEKPDLILMDIRMPDVNGYQATAMIRNEDQLVPIVALTASALRSEKEACLNAGMNNYLSKPFSVDALKAIVTKYLSEDNIS
jgi:signal transduction histidine kinase/CheY-like chemotaxis protein